MHALSLIVCHEDHGLSLEKAILMRLKISRRLFGSVKFQNGLLVNGIPTHTSHRVSEGETITVLLPEASFKSIRQHQSVPLDVAFEDDDLLIVNKPAPLPSQSSFHQPNGTLENHVAAYFANAHPFVYRPVNRLDKGVSGLMAIAKNAYTQHRMQMLLHTDDFIREYLAITNGILPTPCGVIDAPIGKASATGIKRCICAEGKPSVTQYDTLHAFSGKSLLKLRLHTGRTHQIRVHLQSIGCPILGDFLYGTESNELPGRLALHSYHIELKHPLTGNAIDLYSSLPYEMERLLKSN